MVRAHAAFPHTAKAHPAGGQVDDHVVDASAAKRALGHHILGQGPVAGKEIQCQGMGLLSQLIKGRVQVVIG